MFSFFSLDGPITQLLFAGVLGAFLGMRREMINHGETRYRGFLGLRSTSLLAIMGVLSTMTPSMPYMPAVGFVIVAAFLLVAYVHGRYEMQHLGLTTELSGMVTYFMGVLVGVGMPIPAICLTLFVAVLIAFRDSLHKFVQSLNEKEWIGALELLFLSGAILPFLPREPIDEWGVFVPFTVWLLVILISAIEFVGYFLIKYLGTRGGVPLIAFLGSIVSSTAVTTSLSAQARNTGLCKIFAVGILIALATKQFTIIGQILLLGGDNIAFGQLALVPAVMAVTTSIMAVIVLKSMKQRKVLRSTEPEIKVESPFQLGPALKFGLLFLVVLFALALGQRLLGDSGVYAAAILSGIIDVDAIALSSLEAFRLREMDTQTVQMAIGLGLIVNTLVKVVYVALLGTMELTKKVALFVMPPTVMGLVVLLFV